jgi:hypothetical protein
MKIKLITLTAVVATAGFLAFLFVPQNLSLPDGMHEEKGKEKRKDEKSAYHIRARMQYEINMLKDPATGKVPADMKEKELAFARRLPERNPYTIMGPNGFRTAALNNYIPAGPNNIGGRTRAVEYDRRFATTRVIIAGCVSGGIMRSADGGSTWTLVTPTDDIHNLTALAQDPRPGFQDTWYAGSGEAFGNTASSVGAGYFGFGLWKSVDNGVNWTKLPAVGANCCATNILTAWDNPFDYVHNIAVNPVNGDVYVSSWVIAMKSTNGGTTFNGIFQSVTGSTSAANGQMDIKITNTGRVFLAVNGAADPDKRGVWYSDAGNQNTFTRIAGGSTLGVDSVAGWRANSFSTYENSTLKVSKRIIMALAPSNNNIGYVYYENGLSSDPPATGNLLPEADLFRFEMPSATATTFTWSNRSANMPDFPGNNLSGSDPLSLQAGYNMEVAVKPDNPNVVFIGATNLYRSTDGFATNNNTAWIGGYAPNFTYNQYPNSHADIHRLVFHPTDPNRAICGNDGGVQETTNIMAGNVSWTMLPNYQTLQCYNVAIDPGAGRNNFASGSQDNGVRFRDKTGVLGTPAADSNNHKSLISADGAYVGISLDNAGTQYIYESVQLGRLFRARLAANLGTTEITPAGLTSAVAGGNANEFGEFVTNLRLEADNSDNLYYVNFNRLFRTTSASTVTSSTWTEMTGVSAAVNPGSPTNGRDISIRGLAFSRGPYTVTHALFIGTTNGKIFRLDNPQNAPATAMPVDITPSGLTGNVQDIAVNPNNDNEVIAVVSNYNVVSVWWTKNAKSAAVTWRNAEGNLTVPSFRTCAIVVKRDAANQPITEYYVGTSTGLYSTVNLGTILDGNQQPVWLREGGRTLNYAVVTSLAYRPSDNVLLVGTHGNGIFYTNLGVSGSGNPGTGNPGNNGGNFIRRVSPTATTGIITYEVGNTAGVQKIALQVVNAKGQVVYQDNRGYQNGTIPLPMMAAGVYFLQISSEDGKYRHVEKFVRL